MHATIYGRGQRVIPAKVRKEAGLGQGDIVEVKTEGDGRIVLNSAGVAETISPSKAENHLSQGNARGWLHAKIHHKRTSPQLVERAVKYLMDVNLLIAAIWSMYANHQKADAWTQGKELATCPISELWLFALQYYRDTTQLISLPNVGVCP